MPAHPSPATLKRNLNRTVSLTCEAGGSEVVVKRFHAAGAFARLGDRRRARREHAALVRLRTQGVRVPAPLAWRRRDGAWELVLEWIRDSRSLADLLRADSRSVARNPRLVRELGRLLARIHACGVDHRDLHPGNVLIDGTGNVWLIDLGGVRFRRRSTAPLMVRDLVSACAAVREVLPARFRTRFFCAWWRALPEALRARLPERRALIEGVELRGRTRRRAVVLRNRARWLRESGVCRRTIADGRGVLETRRPGRLGERPVLVRVHSAPRWADSGRASDHGIPCASPLQWFETPQGEGLLGFPEGSARFDHLTLVPDRRLFFRAGYLLGTLRDRGLHIPELRADALWVGPGGKLFLGPGPRLRARSRGRWPRLVGLPAPRTRRERACFVAGFVRACRGTARERAELRRELIGG
ncbi:MAG: hypothetical protein CMJ84_01485 [Planctomycetes bacterium]|nr:hypothetical protein [Planctomycetota bacterium]MDP6409621.1 lipopolysaccharide kinase InaA family protein [Planctomycetota bacterium]